MTWRALAWKEVPPEDMEPDSEHTSLEEDEESLPSLRRLRQ